MKISLITCMLWICVYGVNAQIHVPGHRRLIWGWFEGGNQAQEKPKEIDTAATPKSEPTLTTSSGQNVAEKQTKVEAPSTPTPPSAAEQNNRGWFSWLWGNSNANAAPQATAAAAPATAPTTSNTAAQAVPAAVPGDAAAKVEAKTTSSWWSWLNPYTYFGDGNAATKETTEKAKESKPWYQRMFGSGQEEKAKSAAKNSYLPLKVAAGVTLLGGGAFAGLQYYAKHKENEAIDKDWAQFVSEENSEPSKKLRRRH